MKLTKKLLAVAMAAMTCTMCINFPNEKSLTVNAAEFSDEFQYGDYLYYKQVDEEGDGTYDYIEISNCDQSATEIEIPEEIDGLPVTSIGGYRAFGNCSSLTSITIPDSVISIEANAFIGTSLLNNQTGVKYADKWIVDCDEDIETVDIKEGTRGIAEYAFSYCNNLTSIEIPESVTSIGRAFWSCSSLTSINVSENNEYYSSIDGILFNKNKTELIRCPESIEITEYIIPDSVTSIGYEAFGFCSNLKSITISDNITSIGNRAFYFFSGLTSVTIPDSVTSIGYEAFLECNSLESVTIPDSVTSIGYLAFSHCGSLTSVTIGDSVTSIGYNAFWNCSNLSSINVSENNEYYSSIDGILFDKDKTVLKQFPESSDITEYVIPDSVTSIGYEAFLWCSDLESITIPDSVTSIGYGAFSGCSSLESITIPDSVTSIGDRAFFGCSSLESITIPDSVTSIGSYAFSDCSTLRSIEIPDSVTSIEDYVFYGCKSLGSITIPESVTSIGYEAFLWCSDLESITIPDSVTSIGDGAFSNCSSLTSINVSENNGYYSSIDGILFNKDKTELISFTASSEITEYIIPKSVTIIRRAAFRGCSNLESITIPDSVTSIGSYAFSDCSSLESITIGNPECEIYDSLVTICNGTYESWGGYFNGIIYGYENSTAQAYAEKYGYNFKLIDEIPDVTEPTEPTDPVETTTTVPVTTTTTTTTTVVTTTVTTNPDPLGDSNGDGKLNVRDCAFIASALAKGKGDSLPMSSDFNKDGKVNVRDAAAIAQALAKGTIE